MAADLGVEPRRLRSAPRGWRLRAPAIRARAGGWPLAALVYFVTAVGFTWPLILHLGTGLYLSPGRPYGDYAGSIADLQAQLHPFHFPFAPAQIAQWNWPDGVALNWGQNVTWFPYVIPTTISGLLFGARATFELVMFTSFIASGLAMFGLVRRLVDNRLIALLAGWAFAFYPYAVANGEHPVYAHGWPFPLMLWAILRMLEAPSWRRGAVAGGAALLAMAWTSYYLMFGGVAFGAAVIGCLLIGLRERRLGPIVRALVPACLIAGAWLVFVLALSGVDPSAGMHAQNDISAVYQQSARPLNYVLAPSQNFLFGHLTKATLLAHGWVGTEKTLYVGDVLLALAVVAVGGALLGRMPPPLKRATAVTACVLLGCAICSFPPTWHVLGARIEMPSYFIFTHVTSGFRIYERFVIVVECAVCVLGAIGLWVIWEEVARRRARLAVVVGGALCALVVCDLWAPIPHHFERLHPDPIIKVLARQPPGAYADLPLWPAATTPSFDSLFDQGFAGHPIVNGYNPDTADEARAVSLSDVSKRRSREILQALGVKYLLYVRHPHYPLVNGPPPKHGVRVIAQDPYAILYRNTTPAVPLLTPLSGFSYQESAGHVLTRWITAPTAYLEIQAPCGSCVGVMHFQAPSFAVAHTVTVRDAATGVTLAQGTGTTLDMRVRLHFDHTIKLAISASPGPKSIHKLTGSADTRSVSVQVLNPQVTVRGLPRPGGW